MRTLRAVMSIGALAGAPWVFAGIAPTQDAPEKVQGFQAWISRRLNVQQVIKDKSSVDKPAFLSLVYPKEGPSQKDTSVSASLDLLGTDTMKAGLAAEFIEKTGIDKPQNNLSLGVDGAWMAHLGEHRVPGVTAPVAKFNPRTEFELKYKKDGVLTTKGIAGAVRFTMLAHPDVWRWAPYDIFRLTGSFRFKWEPRIGLEYDEVVSAAKDTDPQGRTVRSYAELGLYLYPFGEQFRDRLVLSWTGAHRRDLSAPESTLKDHHYLRTYSLLLYLDGGRRFAIGADRVSGQDPSQGFKEQAFRRLSFKLRLKP